MQKNSLKNVKLISIFSVSTAQYWLKGVLPFTVLHQVLEITAGISAYGICGEE
ncbi:hypothetical protein [Solibacillus merdavium]|uniref:Uncharacterized protein n=1 Tax=Solibacillus merdavium TaxID=2762218 RepID=A0ABR8XT89_9BACL|nr:hypothetical protein [Solibacillus merdavium]MBD8035079.1 hypothetical protein [Solibacillus merdavium]